MTFWAMVKSMITERKSQQDLAQAYEKLKHYSQLIEGQAILRERNYIAREVHDAVGHYLTAQSIQLENVAAFLTKKPEQAQYHLEKSRELLNLALNDIHEVVFSLSHLPFSNSSFAQAFDQLLQDFSRSNSIHLVSHINLNLSLPTEVAITIYRLTQEALTNVIKHSKAETVTISLFSTMDDINRGSDFLANKSEDMTHQSSQINPLTNDLPANFWQSVTNLADQSQSSNPKLHSSINALVTPALAMADQPTTELSHSEYISLVIADNGIGFRLADQKNGFGLRSMHERTAALGGILQIVSDSPQGCVIISRIPKYWHN
jgi:signal transduction histidine kinase